MVKILLAGRVRCSEGEKKTAGKTLLGKPGGLTLTLTKKGFVRKERTMSRISHAQTAVNTEAQRGHKKSRRETPARNPTA